jgi:uncharacterized phage infection (PIP) family protein YhgE
MTDVIQPNVLFPPRRDDPTLRENQNVFSERWFQFFEKMSTTVNETTTVLQQSGEPPAQDVFISQIHKLGKQINDLFNLSGSQTYQKSYDKPIKSIENKLAEYEDRVNSLLAKLSQIEAKTNDLFNLIEY